MELFNVTANSITLLREITREDFNVIRQEESENSICFILDMAEEYWEYRTIGKKVEASYKIRLKESDALLDQFFPSKTNNALTLSYLMTITKVHKLFVTEKNREVIESKASINEEEFYKTVILEINKAVKSFNTFLLMAGV